MLRRLILLYLALLLLAGPALAATGTWNATSLAPGGTATFTWTSASDTGDQPAIQAASCGAVAYSSEVTGSPSVAFYLVPTATTATSSGTLIATVTATGRALSAEIALGPYFLRPALTTVGTGGSVTFRCAQFARGGSGSAATWFASLPLADENMRSAVNQATYEWHHWSMKDVRPVALATIDVNDWQSFGNATTGTCPSLGQNLVQFIYDFAGGQTCSGGTGGGSAFGQVCRCAPISGSTYGVLDLADEAQPHYWTTAISGAGAAAGYTTDIQNVAYPNQMLRLDFPGAGECVAVENVNKPVVFQSRDNPVFYIETTPWNWTTNLANMEANLADTISFVGWKRDDVAPATPGFNFYIDPAVAGTDALIEAELVDAFGMMWVDSKWHFVSVKNGTTIVTAEILDPAAVYGSLFNYLTQHMGGSIAFLIQSDIDQKDSGRKRVSYQVTDFTDSTNWHSTYVAAPPPGTLGSIDSGYPDVGGVGQRYRRIFAACQETGSAQTLGRFFLTQMDVIK